MNNKKKVIKPRREFTRRQLAHWQQRRRRERIIRSVFISVIVAVVGVIGAGGARPHLPPHPSRRQGRGTVPFRRPFLARMLPMLPSEEWGTDLGKDKG